MDASLNQAQANGTNKPADALSLQHKLHFNIFDLVKVGLSSTIAITVLIGIGHVVKHVAGPSAILSILIAAFIAYFVGKLEIPMQRPCDVFVCIRNECHVYSLEPPKLFRKISKISYFNRNPRGSVRPSYEIVSNKNRSSKSKLSFRLFCSHFFINCF